MITNPQADIRAEVDDRPYAPPRRASAYLWVLAALAIAGLSAAWFLRRAPEGPVAPTVAPAPQAAPPTVATPSPRIQYPLTQSEDAALRPEQVTQALTQLLGARMVMSFLQTDDFARRVAATIDSLGREHSPVAAWPVQPTTGAFSVDERQDGTFIAGGNAARYTPFVQFVASIDAEQVGALYRRMYPLLQKAYRELGFGDRYLNDRLVEVIDLLLATPEPAEPPRLQLTEVKGPVPSTRPWVRYQYADPELESLAAGQKILLRVGPAHERTLKAKLAALRKQIVNTGGTPNAPR